MKPMKRRGDDNQMNNCSGNQGAGQNGRVAIHYPVSGKLGRVVAISLMEEFPNLEH